MLFLVPSLLALASLVTASPVDPGFRWENIKYVYAFGDSYTFVQGTNGHTNFSFIGDAANFGFSPSTLLSNEIVPKFTSSDGSNWIEFLTGCFRGLPSNCSPRQLWNFAFAGADIDAALLPLHHNFTIPLTDEVKQWATYASNVLPRSPQETLTAWWIGINDTNDSFKNASITDWDAFWEREMSSYFDAVESAYKHDLRGTYLFINVPPGHRSPLVVNDPSGQTALRGHVNDFNSKLSEYIESFRAKHRDINIVSFDAYTWFNGILDNAARYGFKNITGFCECKDPAYFWYNAGHPTEHVHRLLAQAIEMQLLEASH